MHSKAKQYDARHKARRAAEHGPEFYASIDLHATLKQCRDCREHKPLARFHRQVSECDGFNARCKCCNNARRAKFSTAHPERQRAIHKKAQLRYKYGIGAAEYAAMLAAQNGGCAICKSKVPGGKRRFFSVDHCHQTGRVRGLLCSNCNSGIGLLGDDPARIRSALAYLVKS